MLIVLTASELLARATAAQCTPGTAGVVPYADNFLLGATSPKAGRALLAAWSWITRIANAPMKGKDLRMRSRLLWLGLLLDLKAKLLSTPKATLQILRARIRHTLSSPVSHHFVWQTFGALSYYLYMMRLPLWNYPYFMRWFRRRASLLGPHPELWHSRAHIWPSALRDMQNMLSALQTPQKACTPISDSLSSQHCLYTDASGWGYGVVILGSVRSQFSHPWDSARSRLPIHVLEAHAFLEGLRLLGPSTRRGDIVDAFVDNSAVTWAWRKGNSKDPRLGAVLAIARRLASALGIHVRLKWIASSAQLADRPSRGLSDLVCAISDEAPPARKSRRSDGAGASHGTIRPTQHKATTKERSLWQHRRTGRNFVLSNLRK